jgi:peptidoglycan/xylan/chitin deacetylase (PgdA/CDA1 family)
VLPYNLDTNDMKFFHPNGFVRAVEMVDYVRDGIDQLLKEAKRGKSSTLSIGFHLRISGRPARFRAVTEILEYLAALEGQIWRARRIDIARHFAAVCPRESTTAQQGETT